MYINYMLQHYFPLQYEVKHADTSHLCSSKLIKISCQRYIMNRDNRFSDMKSGDCKSHSNWECGFV